MADVDGRRLDNRAPWRCQPVEALRLDQRGDRPAAGVAGRYRLEGAQVGANLCKVDLRREEAQTLFRHFDLRREVVGFRREDDDAGIEDLLPLDLGDDADDGVVVPGAAAAGVR